MGWCSSTADDGIYDGARSSAAAGPLRAEAAWKNLHRAEALIARLYSDAEVRCEVTGRGLPRGGGARERRPDPQAGHQRGLIATPAHPRCCTPEMLSATTLQDDEAADRQRARIRTFRNVTLVGFVLMVTLVVVLVTDREDFPLRSRSASPRRPHGLPDRRRRFAALGPDWDVATVALLGAVGGMISTAVFVRGLYANPTPYNVAVPLALLKIPTG